MITYKWILREPRYNGIVARYKTRLIAHRYKRVQGVEYQETFSHVLQLDLFRICLTIATNVTLEVHHLDVQTAIFMEN